MGCGVGHRCGLDPGLLWLWCRPAATAQIPPLAWEPPCAMGMVLEKTDKTKQKKRPNELKVVPLGNKKSGVLLLLLLDVRHPLTQLCRKIFLVFVDSTISLVTSELNYTTKLTVVIMS